MSERKLATMSQLELGAVVLACDLIYGGAAGLIWGPEVGTQVAIGMTGLVGGVALGVSSMERAQEFAKMSRRGRAYVEALRGSFETAVGLAIAGATVGHSIGEIPGTLIGGGVGAFIGLGGFSQGAFAAVSRELRDKKDNLGN